MSKRVFLGVGHGGADSGAVGNGVKEKDLNLKQALFLKAELERAGITVGLSRTKDENDDLNEEIRECNAFKPDLAVDLHTNSGGGDGFEAFYTINGGTGKVLAENIHAEVVKLGQKGRGCKTRKGSDGKDYYGFIRSTTCPAVITEMAFIDTVDIKDFDEDHEIKGYAVALAKGICKTLGVAYVAEAPALPADFDAVQYLINNTDVLAACNNASEFSAEKHYAAFGKAEGRSYKKPEPHVCTGGSTPSTGQKFYRVIVGSYTDRANADKVLADAKAKGFTGAFLDVFVK